MRTNLIASSLLRTDYNAMSAKIIVAIIAGALLAVSLIWSIGYLTYKKATYTLTTDDNKIPKLVTLARLLLYFSATAIVVICMIGVFIDTGTIEIGG